MIEEKKVPEKLTVTNFVRISSDTWSGIASNYSFEAGHPHLSHGVRDGVDYIRADIHESALAESRQDLDDARNGWEYATSEVRRLDEEVERLRKVLEQY